MVDWRRRMMCQCFVCARVCVCEHNENELQSQHLKDSGFLHNRVVWCEHHND